MSWSEPGRRIALSAPAVAERVRRLEAQPPEVLECHHLTGGDCLIAKVVARSISDLEDVIRSVSRFGRTATSIVLSSPVERRAVAVG